MRAAGRKCVFFDRDGIVNASPGPGYVERLADFHILPGFVRALRVVRARGYEAVIVSNQRGVALGRVSRAELGRMHRHLRAVLAAEGLELRDVLYCPHDRDQCTCRKPQPGLLLKAAARHRLALGASWMVGDHEKDVEAGRRAGCRTVLVGPGDGPATAADRRVAHVNGLEWLFRRVLDRPVAAPSRRHRREGPRA